MKAINKKRKLATQRILSQLSMLSKHGVIVIIYLITLFYCHYFIVIVMILSAQSCNWLAVAKKKKKKSFRELNCMHSALYDKRDFFHKLDSVKVQL